MQFRMKPTHYPLIAGALVPLALFVAGQPEAAGVVLFLCLVVEMIVSAVTGKKGNDTER